MGENEIQCGPTSGFVSMSEHLPVSQIHQAVETGDWAVILNARRAGLAWDELTNAQGIRALHQAVLMGDTLIIQHMLDWDAPATQYQALNGNTYSPLWAAISRDRDDVGSLLVRAGAECDLSNPFNAEDAPTPPLVETSRRRMAQTTLALIHCGVNLRDLTVEQRAQIFQAWITGLVLKKTGANTVLAGLEATGWYPVDDEARILDQQIQGACQSLTEEPRVALDRLRAAWRQRRSQPAGPAERRAAQRRERS